MVKGLGVRGTSVPVYHHKRLHDGQTTDGQRTTDGRPKQQTCRKSRPRDHWLWKYFQITEGYIDWRTDEFAETINLFSMNDCRMTAE